MKYFIAALLLLNILGAWAGVLGPVALPNVDGRMDHFGDVKGQHLFEFGPGERTALEDSRLLSQVMPNI